MTMNYRKLKNNEIEQLKHQMCSSNDWSNVLVCEKFEVTNILNTHFSGEVKIGSQDETIELFGGIKRPSGIYNSTLHNCTIGKNCYINYVKNHISNYTIGDNVIINNVQLIANEGDNTFGNAQNIAVLDESGGREIMMYDHLSAQLAYIMTLYRYRPVLISKLESMIVDYSHQKKSAMGFIGNNCKIINTGEIKNCHIGDNVLIEGARLMENGSVVSNKFAPVEIGNDVILKKFIIQSGSSIKEGVIIDKCYVGQGCELGKNYSAENSVFFSNCQGFHGEACSIFAGPYTVTHHKSTLLIAGMYSFLNAGSGSNQSNHMYKLGPIHQGIVERGSKTTSDSYLLWPAKIGPFTLIMGRHYKNSDTSDMPFSYLIENKDKSWLAPAVNLKSVGTIRDAMKWPKRDKRTDPDLLDCINYNLLSPYTIQKMMNAIEILQNLRKVSGESSNEYVYNNASISSSSLKRGIELYNIGIDKFLGNSVITRLNGYDLQSSEDLIKALKPDNETGVGVWVDIAGLLSPKSEIDKILDEVEDGTIGNLQEVENRFKTLHTSYYDIEWSWSAQLLEKRLNKTINNITPEDIILLVERWRDSVVGLDNMLYNDAKKEFQLSAMTGFGVDGDAQTRKEDFEMVRGSFETNSFVQEIKSHIERKSNLGDRVIKQIEKCIKPK
ncbi:MAG: DUF4954 family protein [Prolixibacteraceae bacterium]|nr:DUF4954 family protein [Prolixibacteraceae bacterium]MBN2650604.1 DUF4954 family protein [Prolixibacteraceae bacterium]